MSPSSVLPPQLLSIVDRFVARALHGRDEALRSDLYRRQEQALRQGTARLEFYRKEQEGACLRDFEERLHAVWGGYRQVISDAGVPWTPELRQEIEQRMQRLLKSDRPYLEEMARDVIVPHGHGFALFLIDASPLLLDRLTAEIDLFAARYQAVGATLQIALQAPRYSGPLQHWTAAQKAIRESPPEYSGAAREAINALEGIARIVTGSPRDTLGECLKTLKASGQLDGAIAKGLEALWGFASNFPGVRHGAATHTPLGPAHAEYIVGSAEAAGKFLLRLDMPVAQTDH